MIPIQNRVVHPKNLELSLDDFATLGVVEVRLLVTGEVVRVEGQAAIDLVMRVCPHALEGRRLRWARHAWAFHNLVAHPLLQVLSFVGLTRLGLRVHDATVPRPRGLR